MATEKFRLPDGTQSYLIDCDFPLNAFVKKTRRKGYVALPRNLPSRLLKDHRLIVKFPLNAPVSPKLSDAHKALRTCKAVPSLYQGIGVARPTRLLWPTPDEEIINRLRRPTLASTWKSRVSPPKHEELGYYENSVTGVRNFNTRMKRFYDPYGAFKYRFKAVREKRLLDQI